MCSLRAHNNNSEVSQTTENIGRGWTEKFRIRSPSYCHGLVSRNHGTEQLWQGRVTAVRPISLYAGHQPYYQGEFREESVMLFHGEFALGTGSTS
jgi:hypothetical protein